MYHPLYRNNPGTSLASALRLNFVASISNRAAVDLDSQAYQRPAYSYSSERTHVHGKPAMSQTQTHTDSIDGRDNDEVQKKAKSRRPASKLTTVISPNTRRPVDRQNGRLVLATFVQCLTQASLQHRYCLPAAATESMAVSGLRPPTSYISPLLITYRTTSTDQSSHPRRFCPSSSSLELSSLR